METQARYILLVEDEALIALEKSRALESYGYSVSVARTGEQAVEFVSSGTAAIELILMDIDLGPGMDGTEAATRILAEHELPIVFLSSHTERAVVERTERVGSYGYVAKISGIAVLDASIKMAFRLFEIQQENKRQRALIEDSNEGLRRTLQDLEEAYGELRTSQGALAASELRYRQLFENSTAGFALHEMLYDDQGRAIDYRFLDLNPAFERMTGLRAADAVGRTVLELLPQTERYWIDAYDAVARTGEPLAYRNYHEGLGKHFDVWAFSPHDGQFAVLVTDITERVLAEEGAARTLARLGVAEEGLGRLNERLNVAVDAAGMGIWEWDLRNDSLFWDERNFRLFGLNPDRGSMDYAAWLELIEPERREEADRRVRAVLAGDGALDLEFRIQVPGAPFKILKGLGHVLRDERGEPTRMIGVNYDITAERTLSDTRRFLSEHGWLSAGEDFFKALARQLYQSLDLDYVCIDRLEDQLQARTLAVYADGRFEDNIVYSLKDTPCGEVAGKTICCFPKAVRHRFPQDEALRQLEAESYVGTTLFDSSGKALGLIALVSRKPMEDSRLVEETLRLVSIRAAGELERRTVEEELRRSLVQKEVLMKETQHRVKNNLNIVSSLLSLEAGRASDAGTKSVLIEAQNRVRAVSGIYERLYLSQDLVSVELAQYVENLASAIFSAYDVDPGRIVLRTRLADASLDAKRAVPLGLILNELISNALKYAYPEKERGEIRVDLRSERNDIVLSVADDGVGLPPDFDLAASTSMGMMLMRVLAEQLKGTLLVEGRKGTRATLRFPALAP